MLTFTICIWTLFKRTGVRRILCSWSWFYVATALFIVGTVDVLFNLCHNVSAFVNNNHSEGNAKAVFLQISSRVNIMRSAWYDIVTVISDAALIYRCWILWNRRWWVISMPLLLVMITSATAVADLSYMHTLGELSITDGNNKLYPLLTSVFASTLVHNIYCTGMIVYRIWRVDRWTSSLFPSSTSTRRRSKLAAVNTAIVESAVIYTASVLATFISTYSGTNACYGLSDMTLEIAGISFDLIIIRISGDASSQAFREGSYPIQVRVSTTTVKGDTEPSGCRGILGDMGTTLPELRSSVSPELSLEFDKAMDFVGGSIRQV